MGLSFINCLITLECGLGNLDFNLEMEVRKFETVK